MSWLHGGGWVGVAAIAASLIVSVALAAKPDTPRLYLPFAYPPDGSGMMGEAFAGPRSPIPGVTVPLEQPAVTKPASPIGLLDGLFQRLAATNDVDEATGIARRIGVLWLQSGSPTADLLMSRALKAYRKGNQDAALALLDRLVVLQPDWAEAWNRRAFLRFIADDRTGAMEDIAHVLRLEPRHFVALASMAMLLERAGMKTEALLILQRAATLYPSQVDVQRLIDRLIPIVDGRPI